MLSFDDETDDLVAIRDAIIVPPTGIGRVQASGVLASDGCTVQNSISWSSPTVPVNAAPEMPLAEAITEVLGTYMFGGIAYGHFGHFIVESLSRIWALAELRGKIDGIIFTPKQHGGSTDRVFNVYGEISRALGVDVPCVSFPGPVRVKTLYVPRQGFGIGELTGGSRKFRDYINNNAAMNIAPEGAEKIYISRSKLPPQRGGILGEAKLEHFLQEEGFSIFHPQTETKTKQLAQYKSARVILAVDCSPLHLVGYVGDSGQKVGIIQRRSMSFGKGFVRQLTGFKGIECHEINALIDDWLPGTSNRPSRSSFGEISFASMYEQLRAHGLLSGKIPWTNLTLRERVEDLARLEASHNTYFKPYKNQTVSAKSPISP